MFDSNQMDKEPGRSTIALAERVDKQQFGMDGRRYGYQLIFKCIPSFR